MPRRKRITNDGASRRELAASEFPIREDLLPPIPRAEKLECVAVDKLHGYEGHARKHSKRQIDKIARSISAFGFMYPLLVELDGTVISGVGRLLAAEKLNLTEVPVVWAPHLSAAQARALRIADNRLTELAEWDRTALAIEFKELIEFQVDLELTAFDAAEVDLTIDSQLTALAASSADDCPPVDRTSPPTARVGDIWLAGQHRIACGDARDAAVYVALMRGQPAVLVITDPPYNVAIQGHVSGLGKIKHREFVMASGEMSWPEFEAFLDRLIANLVNFSTDGSVHYICMDWRGLHSTQTVCNRHYDSQLNLCVWAKLSGGMGSLYRSQHELVLVYRNGTNQHSNNVQLGRYGRNRTNVWRYEGANSLNPERRAELGLHPTVKPVGMIADAILDTSKRDDIVLDPFLGSGTAVIACEKTGRQCRGIELDPLYVDVVIKRWQEFTNQEAIHAETGLTFEETRRNRLQSAPLRRESPDAPNDVGAP